MCFQGVDDAHGIRVSCETRQPQSIDSSVDIQNIGQSLVVLPTDGRNP